MALTRGNNSAVYYVRETTVGTTPTNPAFVLFGKQTRSARVGLDKNLRDSADLDDYVIDSRYSVTNAYSFSVSFALDDVDNYSEFLQRQSTGVPYSYSFDVLTNIDGATPYYMRGAGWYPNTVRLNSGADEEWMVEVEFVGGTWDTPTSTDPGLDVSGTRQAKSAITDSLRTFSSGAITLDGSAWAILLDSFEITCEHNATVRYDTGSANPDSAATTFGKRTFNGTANFSLDSGGSTHFSAVDGVAEHSIVVPFSTTTGQPKITFSGVVFPSLEMELTSDMDVLMGSQPFVAKTYAVGTV